MPRVCKFPSCHHSSTKNPGCRFKKFPISREKCIIWLEICGIKKTPSKIPSQFYLCSCHFDDTSENPQRLHSISEDNDEEYHVELSVDLQEGSIECGSLLLKNREDISNVETVKDPTETVSREIILEPIYFVEEVAHEDSISDVPQCTPSPKKKLRFSTDFLSTDSDFESEQLAIPIISPSFGWSPSPLNANLFNAQSSGLIVNSTCYEAESTTEESLYVAVSSIESMSSVPHIVSSVSENEDRTNSNSASNGPLQSTCNCSIEAQGLMPPKKKPVRRKLQSSDNDFQEPKQFRNLEIQCTRPPLSYEVCKSKGDEYILFYTGLTVDAFDILYNFLGGDEECGSLKYNFKATPKRTRESEFTPKDKLFMTLIRLKRGFTLKDMELLFDVGDTYVSTIFYTWIRKMSLDFKTLQSHIFVSARSQSKNPPDCYAPFPNVRCVIDCTEFKTQVPANLQQASNMYSQYKSGETVKALIATSVYGGLCFCSEAAEGSISDRKLLLKSGLLDFMKPGDAIMADKGFDIEADLNERGIDLLIPSFLGERQKFSQRELILNKAIATARVHVERFIKYVKDFRFVRYQLQNTLLDITPDIIQVCCHLVMFRDPFIQWHPTEKSTGKQKKTKKKDPKKT